MNKPVYAFEGLELDTARREIRMGDVRRDVQPLVFDMLEYLVRNRDSVVSKDELIENLWPDTVVTDASVTQAIRKARAVLEACGADPGVIRTRHGHGYQLDCAVTVSGGPQETVAVAVPSLPATGAPWAGTNNLAYVTLGLLALVALALWMAWSAREDARQAGERAQVQWEETGIVAQRLVALLRNEAARNGNPLDSSSERAIQSAVRAILESGNERKGQALDLLATGDTRAAADSIATVAADQASATGRTRDAAAASWREAGALYYLSDLEASVRAYEAAQSLQPTNPMNAWDLGWSYIRAGRLDDARVQFQSILRASPPPALLGDTQRGLGAIAGLEGDYAVAKAHLKEALAIAESLPDPVMQSKVLSSLGGIERNQGELALAERHLEEAVALAEQAGDHSILANALNNLGILMAASDRYEEAEFVLNRMLEIQKSRSDLAGQASALGNLGASALERGDPESAQGYILQSIAIGEELGWKRSVAIDLINLGGIAQARGDYNSAENHLLESLSIGREIGLDEINPLILANLGAVARDRGDTDAACGYWADALPALEAMEHGAVATVKGLQQELDCP